MAEHLVDITGIKVGDFVKIEYMGLVSKDWSEVTSCNEANFVISNGSNSHPIWHNPLNGDPIVTDFKRSDPEFYTAQVIRYENEIWVANYFENDGVKTRNFYVVDRTPGGFLWISESGNHERSKIFDADKVEILIK